MSVGVYIPGMEMPTNCGECEFCICYVLDDGTEENYRCPITMYPIHNFDERHERCPLVPVPEHRRLIDADALRQAMYHEAFETDSPMQKWDSGCWIRYKMFEQMEESAPTIIPADPAKE